ncbi:class I SAM-dependent methyltransferase [Microbacterium rhizomatis]|uniref:Class I SAM-dependent methyltransferase n=1 Tax=Microbacterium rhizomatis TaxID=1631477 RepID=A0A5J5J2H7_9MICO|nr:class I SAM-dependent methyltransferase [Microbacterium rhizomatis]KAA9106508.1 class I SAM-dependent methyltransferase [Microbacterium rhizomatis]
MTSTQPPTAAEYWENRYRERGRSWSGRVNAALEREISGVEPGTALDLGSGEGGDALWLAHQGWRVTAVDIAPSALAIGAAAQHPDDDITWVAADLAEWTAPEQYDLVTSCFLHSSVELPREDILRRAASAVAPGGILLIVGHAGVPHWTDADTTHKGQHAHERVELPTPDDVYETLFTDSPLVEAEWSVLTKALVERIGVGPDGSTGPITDSVLTLRRL